MAKADGTFFKVVLIMDQIYEKERVSSVFEAIEEVPPQLEAMIAHVFEKLTVNEDVDKSDLNELLLWVSFAKRELRVLELYAVIKVRTGQAYVSSTGQTPRVPCDKRLDALLGISTLLQLFGHNRRLLSQCFIVQL
jgi:hypothetical protein